jgi:hypothetical protein
VVKARSSTVELPLKLVFLNIAEADGI